MAGVDRRRWGSVEEAGGQQGVVAVVQRSNWRTGPPSWAFPEAVLQVVLGVGMLLGLHIELGDTLLRKEALGNSCSKGMDILGTAVDSVGTTDSTVAAAALQKSQSLLSGTVQPVQWCGWLVRSLWSSGFW